MLHRLPASTAGLYPTDDLEAAKCDAIMDCTVDIRTAVIPSIREQDQAKKVSNDNNTEGSWLPPLVNRVSSAVCQILHFDGWNRWSIGTQLAIASYFALDPYHQK